MIPSSSYISPTQTELPADYVELEKRVDALRNVHTKLLSVTQQYATEAYDYPPNLGESIGDMSRTVSEKVKLLSKVSSAQEAQAALTAPSATKPQPKTFNHAIARASLASAQFVAESDVRGKAQDDPLATGLEKYAIAQERVGEARLHQDETIQQKFLAGWTTTLNTNIASALKARRDVENSRLQLDAIKGRAKARFGGSEHNFDERTRQEVEKVEDEFVNQVETASNIMRNTLDTFEPLRNLAQLVSAQLEFHKRAHELLSDLMPEIEQLQVDQEVSLSTCHVCD